MRKTKGVAFYLAQLKRIAKSEGIKINKEALLVLSDHLEKHVKILCKRASVFAKKERRKIVKARDIKEATREGILFESVS